MGQGYGVGESVRLEAGKGRGHKEEVHVGVRSKLLEENHMKPN